MSSNIILHSVRDDITQSEFIEIWRSDKWNSKKSIQYTLAPKSDSDNWVKMCIIYEKKSQKWDREKCPEFSLKKIKIGEIAKQDLSRDATKMIYEHLSQLYEVRKSWIPRWDKKVITVDSVKEVIVVDGERKLIIEQLIEKDYSEEVRNEIVSANPDLATRLSYSRIIEDRKFWLNEFKDSLSQAKNEKYRQSFFESNEWIFWYGLDYRFMKIIDRETNTGHSATTWRDWNGDLDFLWETSKFTVLVELKKPDSEILGYKKDRTVNWTVHQDLSNAVSQCLWYKAQRLESYLHKQYIDWKKVSLKAKDPKVILIYWNLKQMDWIDDQETDLKLETFELFRRNLRNIEIITYDELYERWEFINTTSRKKEHDEIEDVITKYEDDFPF